MNSRPFIIFSCCVNLALFGGLIYQSSVQTQSEIIRRRGPAITNNVTELSIEVVRAPAPEAPPSFRWDEVESNDYQIYITKLKEIGCPPATIRDIITADVSEQFVRRRTTLLAQMQARYWDLAASGKEPAESAELDKLNTEKETLVDQLAGFIGAAPDAARGNRRPPAELASVPPEKRAQVQALNEQFQNAARQLRGMADAVDAQAKFVELDQQRKAAVAALLTPEERAEMELKNSPSARWPNRLYGFEPTPEEFTAITRLKDKLLVAAAVADAADPAGSNRGAAAKAAEDKALRDLLGDKRYEEYRRAEDPHFQAMYRVAARYQLPYEAVAQAYKVKAAADEQRQLLARQAELSDEARLAALITIQTESEKAVVKALGAEAAQTYLKYDGDWTHVLPTP